MTNKKPTAQRLAMYRHILLRMRASLTGDIADLEADAFSPENSRFTTDNPADTGSDSYAQTFSLELLRRDEAILGEISDALARFARGEFGRCEECAKWIQSARLDAVPYARLCIECQRKTEKEG
ncbi:MAG: TraR/DksA family transcriptional regulator [Planctomycetota bacterium]